MRILRSAIPRLVAVLGLMLPTLLAAAPGPVGHPSTVKLPIEVPPLPEEEPLLPLLGDLQPQIGSAELQTSDDDAILGGPVCSLAQCDEKSCPLGPNRACLLQTFSTIQWRICVYSTQFGSASSQSSKAYEIGPVYLRKLNQGWRKILHRAGPAEIFTPYHSGDPHFYDTQYADWSQWRRTVTSGDAGPNGALITLAQDASFGPTLVAECRDRGPAWLCKGDASSFVRRGQELALWGVFDAGNYDFITEYGFRDDGTLTMRVGATGYNNLEQPTVAHMHDVLWRIDMDLNGAAGDTALLGQHLEPDPSGSPLQAVDRHEHFNDGKEGFADWNPLEFTSLLVEDVAKNAAGEQRGYALEPLRSGTARHDENWTKHDFWVTRWDPAEDTGWAVPWKDPGAYLFPYLNGQSVVKQDIVLWYLASAHHHPSSEDRDSQGNWAVTLTHWFGLELHPHNFFDANPLGGPPICP